MLLLKSLSFLLFLPTLLLSTHGLSYNLHPLTSHFPEIGASVQKGVSNFLNSIHGNTKNSTKLVLAAKRTRRRDPINDFNYYIGGWNISDDHYNYSAAFTAAPFVIIATTCLAGYGLALLLLCLCRRHREKKLHVFPRTIYAFLLILLSLFTTTTIIGCIVLYTGQGKFFNTSSQTLQYVVHQANITVQDLNVVSKYLAEAKRIRVGPLSLPSNVTKSINKIETKVDYASNIIERKAYNKKKIIDTGLDKVSLILIIVAAIMLLLATLGFVFSLLGLQSVVYALAMIGWFLVAGTFVLCGVFLVLHNVVGDTCVAMDEWVHNPTAHTALDDIITCVDNATAQDILNQSKAVTYSLVIIANKIIANISDKVDHNQYRPLVPLLCNPFNHDFSDRICAPGELNFTQAMQVWKDYGCQFSNRACTKVSRLTPGLYEQMKNVVNVSLGIYKYGPIFIRLLDCSIVRETFSTIYKDNCPGLKKYSKRIYIGLVMVAVAVMLSLAFWVLFVREQRRRKNSKIANIARVSDSFGG